MSTVKPHENAIFERDGQIDGWKDRRTDGQIHGQTQPLEELRVRN